jgi:hypothetical protein
MRAHEADGGRRLRRGGFNTGKFPAEQRRGIARRFIEADEKLDDVARHGEELKRRSPSNVEVGI